MATILIEMSHVRVQYGALLAVDDLSFSLKGGDLLGLIGPNGAGKTTTLRVAAGLQPVTTGHVRLMGETLDYRRAVARNALGFAPDTPAVYDNATVLQYLEFIADCYGLDRALQRERIDFWLQQLWLTEKRAAVVKTLSRGMRQRLAVARTLLADPHVILLDEPAAGLDPAGRAQFRQLLASLRDQGKAIIVSSHILADLADYCTHIGIMERGRLKRLDTVAGIAGGAAAGDHVTYQVVLTKRVGDLEARLARVHEIAIEQLGDDKHTLRIKPGREAAADVLRQLIEAGLPVAEFRPLQADLEQAYLRSGIAQVD